MSQIDSLDIDRTMARLSDANTSESSPTSLVDHGESGNQRILPLVADPGNRRVLIDHLDDAYEILTVDGPEPALHQDAFDLCIVDPEGFEQARDLLIEHKEEQKPRILPYLLIRTEDTPLLDTDIQQYIDDVVVMPTSRREFTRRIGSLLQSRELSLELEQKNEQLEYLMGAAAHDLRNPLNIAQAYVQQLESSDEVSTITKALDRMGHLIENLLSVNRTEYELSEESLETVEFEALITDCWEVVPTANAQLKVNASESLQMQAQPELVQQLFENLVRNAVEHGTDTVTISVGMLSRDRGFYIEDDGPGIPVDIRETVFEQGYSTSAGNGLGLTIVKRVADTHGWEIHVTESPSGGARFEITGIETNGLSNDRG